MIFLWKKKKPFKWLIQSYKGTLLSFIEFMLNVKILSMDVSFFKIMNLLMGNKNENYTHAVEAVIITSIN